MLCNKTIDALEERYSKGSVEGRDRKIKLMDEAQGFLNGVVDLVRVLETTIWCNMIGCRYIGNLQPTLFTANNKREQALISVLFRFQFNVTFDLAGGEYGEKVEYLR